MKLNYRVRSLGASVLIMAAAWQAVAPALLGSAASAQTPQPSRPALELTHSSIAQMTTAGVPAAAVAQPRPVVVTRVPAPMVHDDCPSLPDAQVRNLSCSEAAALIQRLKEAQTKLENGEQLYFELLSGALASDPMTKVSPREAFMKMPFEKAFIIERVRTGDRLWQPYKFVYKPAGAGEKIWDVEVVLGFSGERLMRVQMLHAAPPPL